MKINKKGETILSKTGERQIDDFYKHFNLGIEIEGEFIDDIFEKAEENSYSYRDDDENECYDFGAYLSVKEDGSLRRRQPGDNNPEEEHDFTSGTCGEIVSNIIRSKSGERAMLKDLLKLTGTKKLGSEDSECFAYYNRSAGTHIHISFKDNADLDDRLYIFDTVAFEREFINAYTKTFSLKKFANRFQNDYCKVNGELTNKREDEKTLKYDYKLDLHGSEQMKQHRGNNRYYWLNTQSIEEGKGVEIRLFPHLQTINGVNQVLKFTKEMMVKYIERAKTQRNMELLKLYNEKLYNRRLKIDKLNDWQNIVYHALNMGRVPEGRGGNKITGDLRILIAKWVRKKPSLVTEQARPV